MDNYNFESTDDCAQPSLTSIYLFIIGVFLVELFLQFLPEGFMTRILRHRTEEMRYLPPTEFQLMGDSATSAIRAELLEKAIGDSRTVGNYSLPGTSPMFNYFILKRQIMDKKIPKVIIFAPNPFTWGDPMIGRFLGRFVFPRESGQFFREQLNFSDWLYGSLARISYTLRYREELYKLVTSGDLSHFTTFDRPVSSVQNTRAKISPSLSEPQKTLKTVLNLNNIPPIMRSKVFIHNYNEYYMDKFCALAELNKIRIIWVTLPIPESLYPGLDKMQNYINFTKRMVEKHKNISMFQNEIKTMPDSYYADPWHMNPYGAWKFSEHIGGELSHWIPRNLN